MGSDWQLLPDNIVAGIYHVTRYSWLGTVCRFWEWKQSAHCSAPMCFTYLPLLKDRILSLVPTSSLCFEHKIISPCQCIMRLCVVYNVWILIIIYIFCQFIIIIITIFPLKPSLKISIQGCWLHINLSGVDLDWPEITDVRGGVWMPYSNHQCQKLEWHVTAWRCWERSKMILLLRLGISS